MTLKKWQEYGITTLSIIGLFLILLLLIHFNIINGYYESIIMLICINIIAASSLNLATGYLGQLALGHAGFMAIGAYSAALFMKYVGQFISPDATVAKVIAIIGSLLVGSIVACIFGIIIGIPALRLRGDYLGIVTLGFGEIIRISIFNLEFTGGAKGFRDFSGSIGFSGLFILVIIVLTVLYMLIRSRHGRAILSIREDEIAAEAVGVPTTIYKIFGFATSAFFAGTAGGALAFYQTMIDPKKFTFMYSVEIFIIVVLGGMGSLTGTVVAAIILGILNEVLHIIDDFRLVMYSALLIVMMIFRPEGLLGTAEFSFVGLIKKYILKNNVKEKAE